MNYYLVAKLIHILGALGFFIALGVEWLSLWHARRAATSEQVRERLDISTNAQKLGPLSMLLILISGIYMTANVWGGVPWIIIALGALVLMVIIGLALTAPRMAAIRQAMTKENGPVSSSLHSLLHDSRLSLSLHIRASLALGIVFLMTLKPDLLGSLVAMSAPVIVGLVFSPPRGAMRKCRQSKQTIVCKRLSMKDEDPMAWLGCLS